MKEQHLFSVSHAINPFAMFQPHAKSWYERCARTSHQMAEVATSLEQLFALTHHDEEHRSAPTGTPCSPFGEGTHQIGQTWLVMLIEIRKEELQREQTRSVSIGCDKNVTD